jgi:hypothetical protein
MAIKMTLAEALKEALQDDNKISKYEAKVIHEIVTAAGHLNARERDQLRHALEHDHFDDEAYRLLSDLLLKEDLTSKQAQGKDKK